MDNNKQKLILGTVQFGQSYGIANQQGQVPKDSVKQLLQQAQQAWYYNFGYGYRLW